MSKDIIYMLSSKYIYKYNMYGTTYVEKKSK